MRLLKNQSMFSTQPKILKQMVMKFVMNVMKNIIIVNVAILFMQKKMR